jgi:hypothetical protein
MSFRKMDLKLILMVDYGLDVYSKHYFAGSKTMAIFFMSNMMSCNKSHSE